jgi:hypothetical protein
MTIIVPRTGFAGSSGTNYENEKDSQHATGLARLIHCDLPWTFEG